MRNFGMRLECITMRPHDHIGWIFDGPAGFDALAAPFLAEGAERGERLMYIAADPDPAAVSGLGAVIASHGVQVASIAEVYGATGVVDPSTLLAIFTAIFVDALAAGYRGMRVAADNTPLVTDEARLAAWFRWEIIADRFMSENPATAVCAFDRGKVDVNRLRHLATLHPLSSADGTEPRYRLFAEEGRLRVEGRIDSFAVSQIPLALEVLPPQTGVLIDLTSSRLTDSALFLGLRQLCDAGVTVTIRAEPDSLRQLADTGLMSGGRVVFQQAEAAPAVTRQRTI
jgi:MEDS: MEthanogen/methylotroph, DcmR Sensory domain